MKGHNESSCYRKRTFSEQARKDVSEAAHKKKGKKKAKASVKREPSPICVPAFGTNEVIDLT